MTSKTYLLDGFPEDNEFWRIEWFDGIAYNSDVPSEHLIEIALAKIPQYYGSRIQPQKLFFQTERAITQVGIGYLPYLALGSVWQNRKPAKCEILFPEKIFEIDVDTQKFISTSDWAFGGRIIAREKYPFYANWRAVADTKLVAVEYGGDSYGLLIPPLELFRFYYATSTNLAKAACWGEFQNAYDPDDSGEMSDGSYRIHLLEYMDKHDAWTLARYIHSPAMQYQMEQFHRKIQISQVNSGSLPFNPIKDLECGFPFGGKTTIRGLAIDVSNSMQPRWLVLRLTGCTKPLPFGDIVAVKDEEYLDCQGGESDGNEAEGEAVRKIYSQVKEPKQGDVFKSDTEPSRKLKPLEVQMPEDRFDGLKGKKLIKPPPVMIERGNATTIVLPEEQETIDGLGSGDGTWGNSSLRRVRLHNVPVEEQQPQKRKETIPVDLENFMAAMRILRKKHGFEGAFIGTGLQDVRGDGSIFATFPVSNPLTNRSLKWPVLGNGELRRLVIARIVANNKTAYAMEIERGDEAEHYSTMVIALSDYSESSQKAWRAFLLNCSRNNRWPMESETRNMHRATCSHRDWVSVDIYADRLWTCVAEVLGIDVDI